MQLDSSAQVEKFDFTEFSESGIASSLCFEIKIFDINPEECEPTEP